MRDKKRPLGSRKKDDHRPRSKPIDKYKNIHKLFSKLEFHVRQIRIVSKIYKMLLYILI